MNIEVITKELVRATNEGVLMTRQRYEFIATTSFLHGKLNVQLAYSAWEGRETKRHNWRRIGDACKPNSEILDAVTAQIVSKIVFEDTLAQKEGGEG